MFTRQQILDTGSVAKYTFENCDIGIGSIVEVSGDSGRSGYVGLVVSSGFYEPNLVAVLWEKGCDNMTHWEIDSLKLYEPDL